MKKHAAHHIRQGLSTLGLALFGALTILPPLPGKAGEHETADPDSARRASGTSVTIGSKFAVESWYARELDGCFYSKPRIYGTATVPHKADKEAKVNMKVLTKVAKGVDKATGEPAESVDCEYRKGLKLYDKKSIITSVKDGSNFSDAIPDNQDDDCLIPLRMKTKTEDKETIETDCGSVSLVPPRIDQVSYDGDLEEGTEMTITGWHFGAKAPKVMVEVIKGTGDKAKVKLKNCRLLKDGSYNYHDAKGKENKSVMDVGTGESGIVAIYPKINADKEEATGYLLLMNKVGYAVYDLNSPGGGGDGSISVTAPKYGDKLEIGESYAISWSSSGVTGNVNIKIYQNGYYLYRGFYDIANTEKKDWKPSSNLTPGSGYTLKIESVDDPSVYGVSGEFSLTSASFGDDGVITVLSPWGGETWATGESREIAWSSYQVDGDVRLAVKKSGVTVLNSGAISNDGAYNWDIASDLTPGDDYAVFVYSDDDLSVYGQSGDFSISTGGGDGTNELRGTISGSITTGVVITAAGSDGEKSTTSDSEGDYVIYGLEDGDYTVAPEMEGYTFTPSSAAVTIDGAAADGVDFTSALSGDGFSISGTVSGDLKSGVMVTLSGAAESSVTSGSDGSYRFSNLQPGAYIVTPALDGYDFSPGTTSVLISDRSMPGIDFSSSSASSNGLEFAGILLGYSDDIGQVKLVWGKALSGGLPASGVTYHVYQGDRDDYASVRQSENLVGSYEDTMEIGIDGLDPAATYFFLTVAEDAEGNLSDNQTLTAITPLDESMELERTPLPLDDLAGGAAVTVDADGSKAEVAADLSARIASGDPLLVPIDGGQALKKVSSLDVSSEMTTLNLEDDNLSEIIKSGRIRSQFNLSTMRLPEESVPNLAGVPAGFSREIGRLRGAGRPYLFIPEGGILIWEDGPRRADSGFTGEANFTVGAQLNYKSYAGPTVITDAKWTERAYWPDRLDYAKILFGGKFHLSGDLLVTLEGKLESKCYLTLFTKKYKTLYYVGALPVYQEYELVVNAEAQIKAYGKMDLKTKLKLEKTLASGVVWTRGEGWTLDYDNSFTKEFSYKSEKGAGVQLTLTVYPQVSTTFYKSGTAGVALNPELALDTDMDLEPHPHFTKFDSQFEVKAKLFATLEVFSKSVIGLERFITLINAIKLFSLPTAKFTSSPSKGYTLEDYDFVIDVTDGVNNAADLNGMTWLPDPVEDAKITNSTDMKTGTFQADEVGEYKIEVYFDGVMSESFLGPLGMQYASKTITIEPSISGKITGDTTEGVEIELKDGSYTKTATSGADGRFRATDLPLGFYTATPSKDGYTFDPENRSVSYDAIEDSRDVDFTAAGGAAISGEISGDVSAGVTINVTGDDTASVESGSDGAYSVTGLPDGRYTVAPSLEGYVFEPESRQVELSGSSVGNVDFTATRAVIVSGKITGDEINDVLLTLSGTDYDTTYSDSSGNYSFTVLKTGSYTITPELKGYSFDPADRDITVSDSDITGRDFASAFVGFDIYGYIVGDGKDGVTLELTGDATDTVFSAADGYFIFEGLDNGNYTVTPVNEGYSFSPASESVTIDGDDVGGLSFSTDFTGVLVTGRVVHRDTGPMGNIEVYLYDMSDLTIMTGSTTDADGYFTITGEPGVDALVVPDISADDEYDHKEFTFGAAGSTYNVGDIEVWNRASMDVEVTGTVLGDSVVVEEEGKTILNTQTGELEDWSRTTEISRDTRVPRSADIEIRNSSTGELISQPQEDSSGVFSVTLNDKFDLPLRLTVTMTYSYAEEEADRTQTKTLDFTLQESDGGGVKDLGEIYLPGPAVSGEWRLTTP